jgi:outer membrane protein TolC
MTRIRRLLATLAVAAALLAGGAADAGAQGASGGAQMAQPLTGPLTLRDAIARGLEFNLSTIALINAAAEARGQERVVRSALMPNVSGTASVSEQRVNLAALGIRFTTPIPDFQVPETVGPFNVIDLRTRLSQTVFNLSALNSYRAARETSRAAELSVDDSRDEIVRAVGGAYLQVVAARARVEAIRAQIETASAIYDRATRQRGAGLALPIDVNRAQVQVLTEKQRLSSGEAELAKYKITLARLIGLPPTDAYQIGNDVPFAPQDLPGVDEAVTLAAEGRSDLQAADAQVRAAERALAAAQAERLPSVSVNADYGVNNSHPTPFHQTYTAAGWLHVPVFNGGRTTGEIERSAATLRQRRAERDDMRAGIEADIRRAYFDLQAAVSQVEVAAANRDLTRQNLDLARQRFDAGVGDNIAVVQAQESLSASELGYINAVFAHNIAKLNVARNMGRAAEDLPRFLRVQ